MAATAPAASAARSSCREAAQTAATAAEAAASTCEPSPSVSTLLEFSNRRHFKAGRGGNGAGAKKHGKAGENVLILGAARAPSSRSDGELLADLQPARRRGHGGARRARRPRQRPLHDLHQPGAPTVAQKGEPGEERWLTLELKTIADVGLVGYPNVGKSSLLAALTAARPKIGDYPFTTLEPNLGRGRAGRLHRSCWPTSPA